jgi:hypothetical protein
MFISDNRHMLSLPYRQRGHKGEKLPFSAVVTDASILPNGTPLSLKSRWTVSSADILEKHRLYTFNLQSESFTPARLEVTGRSHRQTCVVIGEDHRHIRVYKMDEVNSMSGSNE